MYNQKVEPFVWVDALPLYSMPGRIAIPIKELTSDMKIVSIRNDGN